MDDIRGIAKGRCNWTSFRGQQAGLELVEKIVKTLIGINYATMLHIVGKVI